MAETGPGGARLVGSAALAGMAVAIAFAAFAWGRHLLADTLTDEVGALLVGFSTNLVLSIAWYVPLLFALLLVIRDPSPRSVVAGAGLVYVVDLLLLVVRVSLTRFPDSIDPVIFAAALPAVVNVASIATAVWLAHHGGYERLVAPLRDVEHHPLFAVVAARRIGPGLPLHRGLVAAGLAALLGAAGLALVGAFVDLFSARTSSHIVFSGPVYWSAGIPLSRLPVRWLFEASFLLATLLVTGSGVRPRDLLEGVAIIVGVQTTVKFVLGFLAPSPDPVGLWAPRGPLLTPLDDAILFLGIAVAVWIAFHAGGETHPGRNRSQTPT